MRLALVLLLSACGRLGFDAQRVGDGDGSGGTADGFVRGDVTITNNIAFLSQPTVVVGTLGSASAADQACGDQAIAAGLPGTYVAWISTSTSNAIDRLAGARGWVRVDGVPFADQLSELAASHLMSPLVI